MGCYTLEGGNEGRKRETEETGNSTFRPRRRMVACNPSLDCDHFPVLRTERRPRSMLEGGSRRLSNLLATQRAPEKAPRTVRALPEKASLTWHSSTKAECPPSAFPQDRTDRDEKGP
jgi:hypothetical protein